MLTQLAAATKKLNHYIMANKKYSQLNLPAANGTKRPTNGGNRLAKLFKDRAVASAPEVAKQYDLTNCLKKRCNLIFLKIN